MPKYIVQEKSFINNAMREVGEVVDYEGPVSSNLKPVDGSVPVPVNNEDEIARRKLAAAGVDSAGLDAALIDQKRLDAEIAQDAMAKEARQNAAIAQAIAEATIKAAAEAKAADPASMV